MKLKETRISCLQDVKRNECDAVGRYLIQLQSRNLILILSIQSILHIPQAAGILIRGTLNLETQLKMSSHSRVVSLCILVGAQGQEVSNCARPIKQARMDRIYCTGDL